MKNYRPLLLQEMNVHLPGLRLRRLRLNRHLPEVDTLSEHSHPFAQILCYLSGRGSIIIEGRQHQIEPGTVVLLPSRCVHSFREATGRRPLCLVIDLELRGSGRKGALLARLGLSDVGMIRQDLSELMRLRDPNDANCRLPVAAAALRILDIFLRGLGILSPRQKHVPPFVRQYDRLVREPDSADKSIPELAAQLGYQPDYLNRAFRQATGQTLREYRDLLQIERAKRILLQSRSIREACDELGFADQNYFSRWFKRHTGMQPKQFRATAGSRPLNH